MKLTKYLRKSAEWYKDFHFQMEYMELRQIKLDDLKRDLSKINVDHKLIEFSKTMPDFKIFDANYILDWYISDGEQMGENQLIHYNADVKHLTNLLISETLGLCKSLAGWFTDGADYEDNFSIEESTRFGASTEAVLNDFCNTHGSTFLQIIFSNAALNRFQVYHENIFGAVNWFSKNEKNLTVNEHYLRQSGDKYFILKSHFSNMINERCISETVDFELFYKIMQMDYSSSEKIQWLGDKDVLVDYLFRWYKKGDYKNWNKGFWKDKTPLASNNYKGEKQQTDRIVNKPEKTIWRPNK